MQIALDFRPREYVCTCIRPCPAIWSIHVQLHQQKAAFLSGLKVCITLPFTCRNLLQTSKKQQLKRSVCKMCKQAAKQHLCQGRKEIGIWSPNRPLPKTHFHSPRPAPLDLDFFAQIHGAHGLYCFHLESIARSRITDAVAIWETRER